MKKIVIYVSIAAAIALLAWFILYRETDHGTSPLSAPPANTDQQNSGTLTSDMVQLDSPVPGSLVKSPLTVTGKARGTWYFEAVFPVLVLDANGQELGRVPAQAQGDWMTTDFVPFIATVTFKDSPTATGFIALKRDNPSGLPQNDKEVRYPIRFR